MMSVDPSNNEQGQNQSPAYGSVPSGGRRGVGQEQTGGFAADQQAGTGGARGAEWGTDREGEPGADAVEPPARQFGTTADPAPASLSGQAFFDYVFSDRMADWLLVYVDKNVQGFAKTYQRMRKAGRTQIISWSTPAFFLTFAWFFYRRMWLMGLLFLALPAVVFQIAPDLGRGVLLGMPFVAGLSAKTLYLNQAFRQIYRVDRQALSSRQKHAAIYHRGGVAYLAGLLGLIVVLMMWGMTLLAFTGDLTPQTFDQLLRNMPYGRAGGTF